MRRGEKRREEEEEEDISRPMALECHCKLFIVITSVTFSKGRYGRFPCSIRLTEHRWQMEDVCDGGIYIAFPLPGEYS